MVFYWGVSRVVNLITKVTKPQIIQMIESRKCKPEAILPHVDEGLDRLVVEKAGQALTVRAIAQECQCCHKTIQNIERRALHKLSQYEDLRGVFVNLIKCCNQTPVIKTVGDTSVVLCKKCEAMSPAFRGDKTKGIQGTSESWNRGERV